MVARLGLDRVSFAGFTTRPEEIWGDHHGLILPSHCEGLPLTLVEAMLSARVAIVTPAGGNAEVLSDGETGFMAAAISEVHLDEALERAWARRAEWRAIGQAASARIRALVPPDPPALFAQTLLELL
jgi:glycosyltransferase involved in cell wall biosynthesis